MKEVEIAHTHARKPRSYGFTIVELLIVIVVIAVLAAITIVSYNGIQSRARNAARTSQANAFVTLLELYKAEKGDYPGFPRDPSTDKTYCFGTGFPNGVCGNSVDTDPLYAGKESAKDVGNKLSPYGTAPTSQFPTPAGFTGIAVSVWKDGWGYTVFVYMEGENDSVCPSSVPVGGWNDSGTSTFQCTRNFVYQNNVDGS